MTGCPAHGLPDNGAPAGASADRGCGEAQPRAGSETLGPQPIRLFPSSFLLVILSLVPMVLECQRCTACCRWPGQVRLSEAEITRLAAFQQLAESDFIQRFTRLRQDRRGLALLDQADGACIFLERGGCAVQSVKPQQCRDFPNLWSFPGADSLCRAIPRAGD